MHGDGLGRGRILHGPVGSWPPAWARRTPPFLALPSPEPPRFIKEPKDQIGVSGGVASFVCQATGDPKPRVTWNKKGKKVNSQRFEVSWGLRGVRGQSGASTPSLDGATGSAAGVAETALSVTRVARPGVPHWCPLWLGQLSHLPAACPTCRAATCCVPSSTAPASQSPHTQLHDTHHQTHVYGQRASAHLSRRLAYASHPPPQTSYLHRRDPVSVGRAFAQDGPPRAQHSPCSSPSTPPPGPQPHPPLSLLPTADNRV